MATVDIFLNQTFKLYKSNRLLSYDDELLTASQVSYLKINLSRRLYNSYRQSEELVSSYESAEEVQRDIRLTSGTKTFNGFTIQYFVVRCSHLMPRQMFVFMNRSVERETDAFSTIVFTTGHASPMNAYIQQLLRSMDVGEHPIVIRDYKVAPGYINGVVDVMFGHLVSMRSADNERAVNGLIGQFDITYSLNGSVVNQNLRNIIVSIPNADIVQFLDKERGGDGSEDSRERETGIIQMIHFFLKAHTTVNLNKMQIARFTSGLLSISADGKFKLAGSDQIGVLEGKDTLVWSLVESLYNQV